MVPFFADFFVEIFFTAHRLPLQMSFAMIDAYDTPVCRTW